MLVVGRNRLTTLVFNKSHEKKPDGSSLVAVHLGVRLLHMTTLSKLFPFLAALSSLAVYAAVGEPPPWEFGPGASLSSHVGSKVDSYSDPNHRPYYFEGHTTIQMLLMVCGFTTNVAVQEEAISAVKEWQKTNQNMATVTVQFYRRGGHYHGLGLPPVKMREVSIVVSNRPPD
jgi:hypothetical protein